MDYLALDAHKRYSFVSVEDQVGRILFKGRIPHYRGEVREALQQFSHGAPVAVETTANWD